MSSRQQKPGESDADYLEFKRAYARAARQRFLKRHPKHRAPYNAEYHAAYTRRHRDIRRLTSCVNTDVLNGEIVKPNRCPRCHRLAPLWAWEPKYIRPAMLGEGNGPRTSVEGWFCQACYRAKKRGEF